MTPIDWIKSALGMVVTPSIDHLTTYRAKVVSQFGQTLDVTCDDPRVGSLSGVPIMLGIPGAEVTITAGCFVRVGWRGGDPRYPYVSGWENGAGVVALTIGGDTVYIGDDTGAKAIGLHGDAVALSAAMSTWMTNVAAGIAAGGGGALTPIVGTTIGTLTASATKAKGV